MGSGILCGKAPRGLPVRFLTYSETWWASSLNSLIPVDLLLNSFRQSLAEKLGGISEPRGNTCSWRCFLQFDHVCASRCIEEPAWGKEQGCCAESLWTSSSERSVEKRVHRHTYVSIFDSSTCECRSSFRMKGVSQLEAPKGCSK